MTGDNGGHGEPGDQGDRADHANEVPSDDEDGGSTPARSAVSDELGVPASPPDPESDDHVLPDEKLRYPTLEFDEGTVDPDDGFSLSSDVDRESASAFLDDLAGALASHDLVVAGEDNRVTFGVGVDSVAAEFTPDEDGRGEVEVTLTMPAKALDYAPADADFVGARGGTGFVPRAMLTEDRDPESFRCYNWIDEPAAGLDEGEPNGQPETTRTEDGSPGEE